MHEARRLVLDVLYGPGVEPVSGCFSVHEVRDNQRRVYTMLSSSKKPYEVGQRLEIHERTSIWHKYFAKTILCAEDTHEVISCKEPRIIPSSEFDC